MEVPFKLEEITPTEPEARDELVEIFAFPASSKLILKVEPVCPVTFPERLGNWGPSCHKAQLRVARIRWKEKNELAT